MDFVSKEKRSKIMRSIHSKDTKPEITVRSVLHRLGYRFRVHKKELPGKPDICLPKYRTVIFVHGCFWHHHTKCKEGHFPQSNATFWRHKLKKNIERDKVNQKTLRRLGWKVIVIWECETKDNSYLKKSICGRLPMALSK